MERGAPGMLGKERGLRFSTESRKASTRMNLAALSRRSLIRAVRSLALVSPRALSSRSQEGSGSGPWPAAGALAGGEPSAAGRGSHGSVLVKSG